MNFLSDSHNFPQSYNRIVGGSNARLGQFPWQAVVYALKTNGNKNIQGHKTLKYFFQVPENIAEVLSYQEAMCLQQLIV